MPLFPGEKEAVFAYRGKDQEEGEKISLPAADEYQLMVEHFAHAILTGAETAVSLEESIANLVVLDALAESARSGSMVLIPPESLRP